MTPAERAGMLCTDAQFQKFAAAQINHPSGALTTSATSEWLRRACKVKSRAEIKEGTEALGQLLKILTDYDMWRGRIAQKY